MDYPKSVPGVGLVNGKFIDENVATGQQGSLIPAAWGNAITDEILTVIRAAGITPNESAVNQLHAAIQAISGGAGNGLYVPLSHLTDQNPHAQYALRKDVLSVTHTAIQGKDLNAFVTPGLHVYAHGNQANANAPVNGPQYGLFEVIENGNNLTQRISAHTGVWTRTWITSAGMSPTDWMRLDSQTPAGSIMFFTSGALPDGWLPANGAAVSRTIYAPLFKVIGTRFGAGDGSTTFNLPDLRGEFIRGWDGGRGVDANRAFGVVQTDAIRNIVGSVSGGSVFGLFDGASGAMRVAQGGNQMNITTGGSAYYNDFNFDASRVVPTANENRPRNVALLACIKY